MDYYNESIDELKRKLLSELNDVKNEMMVFDPYKNMDVLLEQERILTDVIWELQSIITIGQDLKGLL